MHSLRVRMIFSHLLPIVLVIPLMGAVLLYLLESQVLLGNISAELEVQATLLAQLANDQPFVWAQPAQAQFFVARISPLLSARVMLLDSDGHLLASSDPADSQNIGQQIQIYDYNDVQHGITTVHTAYNRRLSGDVADVFVPVLDLDQHLQGIIRLTYRLTGVYDRFVRLRTLTLGVLLGSLVVGVIAGWVLALNLERPLRRVTQAVDQLTRGEVSAPIPERGPAEMRTLAGSVNTLVERLHSLELSRKQLLANLVHELGRPLGALRSAIQALQGGANQDPALQQELLSGMDGEVNRLKRLLEDLARLHDQVLGTLELHRQATPLSGWLPGVLAPWREVAQAKGLHWEASLPDDLPTLEIDTDRLGQALGNLLSNAVKYTPSQGTVTVTAGVQVGEVFLSVSDTGPGIPYEEQERLFTPFYRGKQGKRFPQGMGLGLSIARQLVDAHQGRLEMQSVPGEGSRFKISLPL